MAITQSITDTFKGDLFAGRTRLLTGQTGHRIALYTSSANLDSSTTQYTATNEASGTGYVAKGELLTIPASMPTTSAGVSYITFDDVTWGSSTITARGALIYDDNATSPVTDAAISVLDFGSDQVSSGGDFTIQFPTAGTTTAIIRIGG